MLGILTGSRIWHLYIYPPWSIFEPCRIRVLIVLFYDLYIFPFFLRLFHHRLVVWYRGGLFYSISFFFGRMRRTNECIALVMPVCTYPKNSFSPIFLLTSLIELFFFSACPRLWWVFSLEAGSDIPIYIYISTLVHFRALSGSCSYCTFLWFLYSLLLSSNIGFSQSDRALFLHSHLFFF